MTDLVVITDGAATVIIDNDARTTHHPRVRQHAIPGKAGSVQQYLNRGSREKSMWDALIYTGDRQMDLTQAIQMGTWAEQGTIVNLTSLLGEIGVYLREVNVTEPGGGRGGFLVSFDAVEASPASNQPRGGIASHEIARTEIARES